MKFRSWWKSGNVELEDLVFEVGLSKARRVKLFWNVRAGLEVRFRMYDTLLKLFFFLLPQSRTS